MCMSEGCRKRKYSNRYFFFEIFFSRALLSDRYPYLIICCSILDIRQRCILMPRHIGEPPQYTSSIRMRSSEAMLLLINKHMLCTLVLSYFYLVSNSTTWRKCHNGDIRSYYNMCCHQLFALSEQQSLVKRGAGSHCCSKVTNRPAWTNTYHN